jgi:hypothetical protein
MILTRKNGIVREWKINQVGWPYHGLVTDDALEYKSGSTADYPAQSYPMWHKFQGNRRNAPPRDSTQQTADASAGRQWLDYAIIAGHESVVAGQKLGPGRWLYSDPNGNNWILHAFVTLNKPTTGHAQLTLQLEGLFGRFDGNTYPALTKELATLDLGSVYTAYTDIDTDAAKYWFLEPNLTGSAGYINITETMYPPALYGYGGAASAVFMAHHAFYVYQSVTDDDSGSDPHTGMRALRYVVSFAVTGKGVIHVRDDLLGRNIVGTLTLHKGPADLETYASVNGAHETIPTWTTYPLCSSPAAQAYEAWDLNYSSEASDTIDAIYYLRYYADGTALKAVGSFVDTDQLDITATGEYGPSCTPPISDSRAWTWSCSGTATWSAKIMLGDTVIGESSEVLTYSGSGGGGYPGYYPPWRDETCDESTSRSINGTTVNWPHAELQCGIAVIWRGNRTFWLDIINDPPISASATNDSHTLYKVGINVDNEAVVADWETGDYYEVDNVWGYCPTGIDNIAFDPISEEWGRDTSSAPVYWT